MKILGLEGLIAPLAIDEFFANHWPARPLFIPPVAEKLASLLDLPQLQNLESLLAARVLKVRACLPDYEDEFSSVLVEPEEAIKLYRNNMTLLFDSMQKQDALIAGTLLQLRSDLGLPLDETGQDLSQGRSMAYATPAGGHTRLHFDANANFVIQVRGSKRWMLAANTSVENPTDRYTSCTGELAAELEQQCHDHLLDELPENHTEHLLTPGSVLFVPRGYWHETTTEEDSLSLNFTFGQPTWADLVTGRLHTHLQKSAPWRELADGLGSRDSRRQATAVTRFEAMLKKLGHELAGLSSGTL